MLWNDGQGLLVNLLNTLPEREFSATVDAGNAAPGNDLSGLLPETTEHKKMSEQNTITRAKREVVQRTSKAAKKRGVSAVARKLTLRRGLALSQQPGYVPPCRKNNAGISLLIDRSTYRDVKKIAKEWNTPINTIFQHLAAAFVQQYQGKPPADLDSLPLKIDLATEQLLQRPAAKKALRRIAAALQASTK